MVRQKEKRRMMNTNVVEANELLDSTWISSVEREGNNEYKEQRAIHIISELSRIVNKL
jgi:hypothetical protein